MKKIYITLIILITLLSGAIILPKILISHADTISAEDISCSTELAHMTLENPIERLLITETVVTKKIEDTLTLYAYMIGGLHYATVEVDCNGGTSVTWRRWE